MGYVIVGVFMIILMVGMLIAWGGMIWEESIGGFLFFLGMILFFICLSAYTIKKRWRG